MGSQLYNARNVKQVKLALNMKTDADIIRHLESIQNMQGYIKGLIRANMKEEATMKYQVNLNGSPIDTIKAPAGYTAAEYIADCRKNADQEWCDMLDQGTVTLDNVTEFRVKEDYLPMWGSYTDDGTVITMDDVEQLSREWERPVDELLEQLEQI